MTVRLSREQAIGRLRAAIIKADQQVLQVREQGHRDRLHQGIITARMGEARRAGIEAIRAARKDLDNAVAAERRQTLRELRPTAQEAAERTLYATRGMALANAGMRDLAAAVRDELAAGNQGAAREYLAAGGSKLRHHLGSEYGTLQRAAMSTTDGKRAATREGLDTYAAQLDRLDGYLQQLPDRLGMGGDPADPDTLATRQDVSEYVARWHDTAETTAADAGSKAAEAHTDALAQYGLAD